MKHKSISVLLIIILLSLAIRLWGIWFGLPYLYHQDETHEVIRALELGTGGFTINRVGKGGYFYLLFFEYGIFYLLLKLFGFVNSATDFALFFIKKPWPFYLIGRTTTALIGTLNVFITYKIGKEAYSRRVGIIAALFLAFNYLHTQSSHYITVDVPMTCLATLSLMYIIRISHSGNLKNYILACIFAGLAIQTKSPAIVLVVPILLAHYYATISKGQSKKEFFLGKHFLIGSFIGVLVLVLGNPGLLINSKNVAYGFYNMYFGTTETLRHGPPSMDFPPNLFLYYLYALKTSMGLPMLIFSLAGLAYGLYRHEKEDMILISYVLPFYLLMSTSKDPYFFYHRYIIPIIPVLVLLCSRFMDEISAKLIPLRAQALSAFTACLLIIQPGYKIVRENYFISQKDTRTFAKEWIEDNIPAGSRILIEGMRTKPREDTVPLQYNRENIARAIERYREKESGKAMYFELELKVIPEISYDLITVGVNRLRDLAFYKKNDIEYIVLRADIHIYKRDWLNGRWKGNSYPAGPDIGEFLQILRNDPNVKLIKRFEPNKWNRPGPTIEIYKIERADFS